MGADVSVEVTEQRWRIGVCRADGTCTRVRVRHHHLPGFCPGALLFVRRLMKSQAFVQRITQHPRAKARGLLFSWFLPILGCALLFSISSSCSSQSPRLGSQTNWLRLCVSSSECGDLECICGTCTRPCESDDICDVGGLGACVATTTPATVGMCAGESQKDAICLPRCDEQGCPSGSSCLAGVCTPVAEPSVQISLDPATRYQTLIGFGASLAYLEDFIVEHERKSELFDLMFEDSGLDMVRFRNRFEGDNSEALDALAEVVDAAQQRLGRRPTLLITSGSPPAALKENGVRYCDNADISCTLARTPEGDFDYEGFGEYWRSSLEAYAASGLAPDFVSIQNNPDWIPGDDTSNEACRFLPTEGRTLVATPEGDSEVEFPGYVQALAAVKDSLGALGEQFSYLAPETSQAEFLVDYASQLDPETYDAHGFHLYGSEGGGLDRAALERVGDWVSESAKPLLQSEMSANGFDTAQLLHHALTDGHASSYLQQHFVGTSVEDGSGALIGASDAELVALPAFYAIGHYAKHTGRGWVRIDASSDHQGLLVSAWLSPEANALTWVLINVTEETQNVQLTLPDTARFELTGAEVFRTMFEADERAVNLGPLSGEGIVPLPARSMVTVSVSTD